MPYVTERWLGGLLTNFITIRRSLERLRELEMVSVDGRSERLTKKELAHLEKERLKLETSLSGIKTMKTLPDAVFVIDTRKEAIAVAEARKLRIPVVGIVDTNCDPDEVDFVVPGNDDALRAIKLFAGRIADAVIQGRSLRDARAAESAASERAAAPAEEGEPKRRTRLRAPASATTVPSA